MNGSDPRSWLNRALGAAITCVVVALLLSWAWALLKPLVPVIGAVVVLVLLGRWWLNRWRL